MKYLYEIGGLRILCEIPFELTIEEMSRQFVKPVGEVKAVQPDLTVHYRETEKLQDFEKEKCFETACRYFEEQGERRRIYYSASPGVQPYACVSWNEEHPKEIDCHYLKGAEKYLDYGRNITEHLGLENLLWMHGGILLHASFVSAQGKGILFSGPSGIGKSTQAKLWETYRNAEIINGDRAAIRPMDGEWFAWGSPCAGTSGIYKNKSARIDAIIVLRQAASNHIHRMLPAEAFVALYPEMTVHGWDRAFVEDASECLKNLLKAVPVYLLECIPDETAVSLVGNAIEK